MIGCYGNCTRVASGRYLDLVDPQPDQFTFDDIATGLAKLCRFNGQLDGFYSVAEHSVICSRETDDPMLARALLLHDASEAFISDVCRPAKIRMKGTEYTAIERRLMHCIAWKFNLFSGCGTAFNDLHDAIKAIDSRVLFAEKRALMPHDAVKWEGEDAAEELRPGNRVIGFPWDVAKIMFVMRAKELGLEVDHSA